MAPHCEADTLEIKIGAANATDHAAAFIGVEKGIFARHGLDAKIVMYQTGVEMINGLLAGAQDVNIMGSIPFLAGTSRDQPLVLIRRARGAGPLECSTERVGVVHRAPARVRRRRRSARREERSTTRERDRMRSISRRPADR